MTARAAALALGLAAGAAGADGAAAGELIWPESPSERRMLLADEAAAFRAVGRLNIAGARFCTATLVSPTEALTAAHCLFHPRTRRAVPLAELRFVPGHRIEENVGVFRVARAAVAPGFVLVDRPTAADLDADVALLELEAPVDAAAAPPFPVGPLLEDAAPTTIVSYARDRAQAPSISEGCPPMGVVGEVLVVNCVVERGVSGAPVLARDGAETRVVAVVSAMGALPDGAEFALAVLAQPWIATLRADLAAQAALGPAPAGEGDAPVEAPLETPGEPSQIR